MSDDEMVVEKPEGMNDAAVHKPGRIAWCPPGKWSGEVWNKGRLRRSLDGPEFQVGTSWLNGVEQICQWADDPTWQRQATYVVQAVMNGKKVSQDEAVEKIKKWVALNKKDRENRGKEPSDEERFAFNEQDFTVYKPAAGVATAKLGASIPWCDAAGTIKDRWDPRRISRTVDARYGISGTIEGALHLCQRPKDPTWITEAGYVLQKWMNWTKQSQAEAEASLRARIQIEKFAAEQEALCKKLEVSPELGGQAKSYADTHRAFFGCNSDKEEMWRARSYDVGPLSFYFDGDETPDELVRVAWLFHETKDPDAELPSKTASGNVALLKYAVLSVDFAAIDSNALAQKTAKAPFNSSYAKAIVSEMTAIVKWRKKMYEEAIDKLIKSGGDEYATILREAPKKGFAEWRKVTEPWKTELERSASFEKKLSNPSRKVLAGCSAELFPDAHKLIRSYKKYEYNELINQIASDPIASLLLSRLALCFAYEQVPAISGVLRDLVKQGRDLRGPRSMAYYAIVDAIVEIQKDRPGLLLGLTNFYFSMPKLTEMYPTQFHFSGNLLSDPEKYAEKGIIKEVKKTGDRVQIVYKQEKYTWPEVSCRDTRKPIRIRGDGTIEYEQYCVETGKMNSQDQTPKPSTVHPALAAGLTAGAYVVVIGGPLPAFVKNKAKDKKIVSFYGFLL